MRHFSAVRWATAFTAIALIVAACSSSSTPAPKPTAEQDPSHPNFVFVLTDDLSMNLVAHMSAVQQMQRAGTTLSRYYVVDSLCCPSRSAIFTGQYPHDDGVFTNTGTDGGYTAFNSNGDEQKSFALALHDNGYQTAMMGKYLNGYKPSDPVPPGWDTWDVAGQGGYGEFGYRLNENGAIQRYGHAAADYLTDVLAQKAQTFITTARKPFMLEVATFAPHAPYTPSQHYAGTSTATYPRTAAYGVQPTDPPSWLKGDPALTQDDDRTITDDFRKRVEAVQSVNDLIEHLEATLKAKGVADNTYLVFSSDNGYHMGEYRLLPGKQTAFDTDIHVPLVVSGPHVPAGKVVDEMTSSIDLAPTFEALSGTRTGTTVDGVSLAALWHGQRPSSWQQAVLVEHHHTSPNDKADPDAQTTAHADPPTYEAVRTANALYVRYADGEQEYYDTASDPDELHNLGARGVPAAMVATMNALENCHGSASCQRAAGT